MIASKPTQITDSKFIASNQNSIKNQSLLKQFKMSAFKHVFFANDTEVKKKLPTHKMHDLKKKISRHFIFLFI